MRPGDLVTLSISPTIQLADYKYAKPHASLSRTLGDNPEADLQAMEADLRVLSARALAIELGALSEFNEALTNGGIESLVGSCLSIIEGTSCVPQVQARNEARNEAAEGKPQPRRKPRA